MKPEVFIKFVAILFVLLSTTACNKNKFSMNVGVYNFTRIDGEIISGDHNEFKKSAANEFTIASPMAIALKRNGGTTFDCDMSILVAKDTELDIYCRSSKTDYRESKTGDKLTIKKGELSINDNFIYKLDIAEDKVEGDFIRLRIIGQGKKTTVFVDCAEIYKYESKLPLSQYVILDNHQSRTLISGISFENTIQSYIGF